MKLLLFLAAGARRRWDEIQLRDTSGSMVFGQKISTGAQRNIYGADKLA